MLCRPLRLAVALIIFGMMASSPFEPAWGERPDKQSGLEEVLPPEEEQIVSALPRIPRRLNKPYSLLVQPSRSIATSYIYTVDAPNLKADEWVLFVAQPPNHLSQVIKNAGTNPSGVAIRDLSRLRRPLIRTTVPVEDERRRQRIVLTVRVEADLFSRRLVANAGRKPRVRIKKLTDWERRLALRPTARFDYTDDAVRSWIAGSSLHRSRREGEVDYSRRVYQAIVKNFQYEYLRVQDRSASFVCTAGKSDCGGLCSLFVATLRSQGIPARTLAGRWAESSTPGARVGEVEYFQEHVKAEFYAQGVGWVPADLSSAVLHDESPQKLRFFGDDPGDFLTMHVDTDLSFDTMHFGEKTMVWLQKPSYWATGSGSFQGVTISEEWVVR